MLPFGADAKTGRMDALETPPGCALSGSDERIPALGRNGTNQGKHPDSGRRTSMLRGRLNAEDAERSAAFVTQAAPIERVLAALGEPLHARRQSRPPGNRLLGRMLPSRCRTGISSPSPSPTSSLINASSGNRSLAPARDAAAPLSSPGGSLCRVCSPQQPENARAPTARDLCQPRRRMLTANPASTSGSSWANLLRAARISYPSPQRSNSRRSPGATGGDG
jgi:hypothetical protein